MPLPTAHFRGTKAPSAAIRLGTFATLALLVSGLWALAEAAQVNLSISPGVVDIVCEPGKPATFTFNVVSDAAAPMRCSIAVTPMDVNSAGIPAPSAKNGLPDLSRDVVLTPKTFALPKGKFSQTLTVKVALPPKAVGGRYAMIACSAESVATPHGGSSAGLGIVPEVRAVMMVTAKGAGSIATPKPVAISITSGREKPAAARGVWTAEMTIRNTGNCHVALDGKIIIRSLAKRVVDSAALEGGYGLVFPGRERVFKAVGPKALPDGSYQAEMQMTSRGSTRVATESVYFTVEDGTVAISGIRKPAPAG